MKHTFKALLLIFLISGSVGLMAQGAKTLSKNKVSSRTVQEYFIEEGMDTPVVESYEAYDEDGEVIELKEYSRKGEVKTWEKYVYNENGDLVEEIFLDSKGRVDRTEKTVWEEGLKVEKLYYNQKDQLYKRKVYAYEFSE